MVTIAIIILVVVGLGVILGSIRKRKLLINKGVLILIAIAMGILYFNGAFSDKPLEARASAYQNTAPSISQAPYLLDTPSRAYYVVSHYENEHWLVLTEYYSYDRKKWEKSESPLAFDKSLPEFAGLSIVNNTIGGQ